MTIGWEIRAFKELSAGELYNVLRLRSEVFVVEQNCVYQDIDNKDQKALHLIGSCDGQIIAYARLFKPGDYFDDASIGRVVIDSHYREKKWGHDLMRKAIGAISLYFNENKITISAQSYLKAFYSQHGFKHIGEEYLEDDIPHIRMQNY
jgi:ElaA protein